MRGREWMFGRQPVIDADHADPGPRGQPAAERIMRVEAADDEAAAMEEQHAGRDRAGRLVTARRRAAGLSAPHADAAVAAQPGQVRPLLVAGAQAWRGRRARSAAFDARSGPARTSTGPSPARPPRSRRPRPRRAPIRRAARRAARTLTAWPPNWSAHPRVQPATPDGVHAIHAATPCPSPRSPCSSCGKRPSAAASSPSCAARGVWTAWSAWPPSSPTASRCSICRPGTSCRTTGGAVRRRGRPPGR